MMMMLMMVPKMSKCQLRCRTAARAAAAARRLACWPAPAGALTGAGAAWTASGDRPSLRKRESELFLFLIVKLGPSLAFFFSIFCFRFLFDPALSLFIFSSFSRSLARSLARLNTSRDPHAEALSLNKMSIHEILDRIDVIYKK